MYGFLCILGLEEAKNKGERGGFGGRCRLLGGLSVPSYPLGTAFHTRWCRLLTCVPSLGTPLFRHFYHVSKGADQY